MDVQDKRVRRTQELLAKALIALTLDKGYDAVTIRDITEQADVGYATFFRHYQDKEALLRDVSEVVLADLKKLLPSTTQDNATMVGMMLFRYVRDHCSVIRVLLSSRSTYTLLQYIADVASKNVLAQQMPAERSVVPPEIAAYHIANSSIALVQWWVEHDMPYPPEQMGMIFDKLIVRPTHEVAFSGKRVSQNQL